MKTIVVAGTAMGVGKTEVAALLLKNLKNWAAIKITVCRDAPCPKELNCGICKNPPETFKIIDEQKPEILSQENKDTYYLNQAATGGVLWIQTRPRFLAEAFKAAIKQVKSTEGVVVESTSILKHIKADLAILVTSPRIKEFKPSAQAIVNKIDLIVVNAKNSLAPNLVQDQQLQQLDVPVLTLNFEADESVKTLIDWVKRRVLG